MAVPTINSVSPSSVWTGGQLVTVTGTNFRLWVIPPTSSAKLPAPVPTMKVTIDGEECTQVEVESATKLYCRLPPHDPGAGALTVTNLDDDGDPIAGETATLNAAVTFKRPDLTDAPDLERVNKQVIIELRRQVLENVLQFVSADYAETPYELAAISKVPALVLSGPSMVESDAFYRDNGQIHSGGYPDTTFDAFHAPYVVDLQYDLTAVTKNQKQLINLQAVVALFFDRNHVVRILRDVTDVNKGYVSYDMELQLGTQLRNTTEPNKDDIRSFITSFVIRGVNIESLASFPSENLAYKGGVVDNVVTTSVKL